MTTSPVVSGTRPGERISQPAGSLAVTDLFARPPAPWSSDAQWFARHEDGRRWALTQPLGRWLGPVDAGDRSMLARVAGAALDLGCGPGRLVVELARRGCSALGV